MLHDLFLCGTRTTGGDLSSRRVWLGDFVKEPFSRSTTDHCISDPICMLLPTVSSASNVARQTQAFALLDHVRCLMRCQVEIRRLAEGDARP